MSKEQILINASDKEELRVALINNGTLDDLDVEFKGEVKRKANIYKAKITRIEPSLEAAFVEFGASRQGFLPLKEIAEEYYTKSVNPNAEGKPSIKDLVKEGQELIIQVDKDERGTKGAALTTYITLAGCYLVLMTNNPNSGGISRRIDGDERDNLKEILDKLDIPEKMGIIVRTAGVGRTFEELQWDFEILKSQWEAINKAAEEKPAPFLIHQEGDIVIRSIRDNLRKEIDEVLIDDQPSYVKAKNYLQQIKPELVAKLKLYQDNIPLFVRYQVEHQIETAFLREVKLPSGGSIVIDRTEALVSIDINSAKATGGHNIEATAFSTNLEAAAEIARQLRLRDLGGLIVIDFIDMNSTQHQREVENALKDALRMDRARIQVGRISRFGLLEMSRQRLRLSLGETIQQVCPTCTGRGTLRSIFSMTNSLIRLLEEEAVKAHTTQLNVHLPVDIATFIMNEKRDRIIAIERRYDTRVFIIPNQWKEFPEYEIERIEKNGKTEKAHLGKYSFELKTLPNAELIEPEEFKEHSDVPAIKESLVIPLKTPGQDTSEEAGFLKKLWNSLFSSEKKEAAEPDKDQRRRGGGRRGGGNRRNNNSNNRRRYNNRSRGGRSGGGSSSNKGNQQQASGNRQPSSTGHQQRGSGSSGGGNRRRRTASSNSDA